MNTIMLRLATSYRRHVAIAALTLGVILFGDVVFQTAMHITWRGWITRYAAAAQPTTQPTSQPSTTPAEKPPKRIEVSAAVRKRNVFAPPAPKGHNLTLTGVLGNLVFFRAQSGETVTIQEGSSDRGVTVKSINGYEVTIEFEGKPQTMKLFDGAGGGAPGGPAGPPPDMGRMPRSAPPPMPAPTPGAEPVRPVVIEGGALPEGIRIEGNVPPEVIMQLEKSRADHK